MLNLRKSSREEWREALIANAVIGIAAIGLLAVIASFFL